jgi:ABC-type bacteriocin/lantibiotic exporter with double-glycine peptidase domain
MKERRGLLKKLHGFMAILPPKRRRQLAPLLALMLLSALAEMLSLAAIVPFLAILADPVQAMEKPFVMQMVTMFDLGDADNLRWRLTQMFASAAVAAGAIRFTMIYVATRLNYTIGYELGTEVYRRSLYQPYEVHIARNSSEIMGAIDKLDNVVFVISSMLTICSSGLMALFIVATLVLIDPLIAGVALLGFGSVYAVLSMFTRKRLAKNSRLINLAYGKRIQSIQEGLGGIREILLDQTQPLFVERFNETEKSMRLAQASTAVIGGPSPRIVVEALGIVLIAFLGYYITAAGGGIAAAIPTLGVLALGAQRLMPLLQQTYQGWAYISGNVDVLSDVTRFLQVPAPEDALALPAPLPFRTSIQFRDVAFRYQPQGPLVLRDFNLIIPQGARIGFVGHTGSGKSTAMDLLLGLLQPATGQIFIDDVPLTAATGLAWQRNIGHVPQAIFLIDASFAENIAFGLSPEAIDLARVREAAERAQIADFIESTAEGYSSGVGERGIRLSGGQRQRIGIARALYKRAKVLVFDEATSALDGDTEIAVMQAIESLGRDLTIVLIAHRISTLRDCDVIYRLNKGCIVSQSNYEEFLVPTVNE